MGRITGRQQVALGGGGQQPTFAPVLPNNTPTGPQRDVGHQLHLLDGPSASQVWAPGPACERLREGAQQWGAGERGQAIGGASACGPPTTCHVIRDCRGAGADPCPMPHALCHPATRSPRCPRTAHRRRARPSTRQWRATCGPRCAACACLGGLGPWQAGGWRSRRLIQSSSTRHRRVLCCAALRSVAWGGSMRRQGLTAAGIRFSGLAVCSGQQAFLDGIRVPALLTRAVQFVSAGGQLVLDLEAGTPIALKCPDAYTTGTIVWQSA